MHCNFVNITSIADGAEALNYLEKKGPYENVRTPHLILLDLNIPRKDGWQVLKEIKAHPKLNLIPVIIFTGSSRVEDMTRSYEFGANCFITKPSDIRGLDNFVKTIRSFWLETATLPVFSAAVEDEKSKWAKCTG